MLWTIEVAIVLPPLPPPIWTMDSTISDNYIYIHFLIVLIISHELKKIDDNYTLARQISYFWHAVKSSRILLSELVKFTGGIRVYVY